MPLKAVLISKLAVLSKKLSRKINHIFRLCYDKYINKYNDTIYQFKKN